MERLPALDVASVPPIVLAIAVLVLAWLAHAVLLTILRAAAARRDNRLLVDAVSRMRQPTRWLTITLALAALQPAFQLSEDGQEAWSLAFRLAVPALLGWVAMSLLATAADAILAHTDLSVSDNLQARRRRTRILILQRLAGMAVLFATVCWMLMAIPSIRSVGVTLIASAGLAALVVGAAAQPALKNVIAGLQMAFTEPVRIDDVVIIAGEWGRVEEIRLTYVVVKLWDERRLVVPVSKLLEESFQNWTRSTSAITGSVFFYLDPTADVARLRAKLEEIVTAHPLWDGRSWKLQVTEARDEAMELRAVMTAANASAAFDLRCAVREALLGFIAAEMPEALVRRRAVVGPLATTVCAD